MPQKFPGGVCGGQSPPQLPQTGFIHCVAGVQNVHHKPSMRILVFLGCVLAQTALVAAQPPSSPQDSPADKPESKPTVAVVLWPTDANNGTAQVLAEPMYALLEQQLAATNTLRLVERRELAPILKELNLGLALADPQTSAKVGQLASAEFVATLQLRQSNDKRDTATALLRVTEVRSTAIIGATAMTVDAARIEEFVDELARFTTERVHHPTRSTISIAVAPFDSQGRFDRLRPLETGIRDLISSRLSEISSNRWQVLQRSQLADLVAELELARSGLVDNATLDVQAKSHAAYMIRGTLDERPAGNSFNVLVAGELVDVFTGDRIGQFQMESPPEQVDRRLAEEIDRLAKQLQETGQIPASPRAAARRELEFLKQKALADLRRFRKINPLDFTHRPFRLPEDPATNAVPRLVQIDTPLGRHLLTTCVDRLESVLLLSPDDLDAAFGLAFCAAIHLPELYRPDRADELYRRILGGTADEAAQVLALEWLPEIAYHHETGKLDSRQREETVSRIWKSYDEMPERGRGDLWERKFHLLAAALRGANDGPALAKAIRRGAEIAEHLPPRHRRAIAWSVQFAYGMYDTLPPTQRTETDTLRELLGRWSMSVDKALRVAGTQGLATANERAGDFLAAARGLEASAADLVDDNAPQSRHDRELHLINAAKNYILGKDPTRGLEVLQSFEPPANDGTLRFGMHRLQRGIACEALDQPTRAVAAYLEGVELCPNLVWNSDVSERIEKLGGIPLAESRAIDVQYIHLPELKRQAVRALTTDGTHLYFATLLPGLWHYDPQSEQCERVTQAATFHTVRHANGAIWGATANAGLWRVELSSGVSTHFGAAQGLPDERIVSIAVGDRDIFAGVGTNASGGIVRIGAEGDIEILNSPDAPQQAPTHLVVTPARLLARTTRNTHELNRETGLWKTHPLEATQPPTAAPFLFQDGDRIWSSRYGRELALWDRSADENATFRPAWHVPDTKAGYQVRFALQRGDEVWFGGQPRAPLLTSGLYRFNRRTGEYVAFGPRDGFRMNRQYEVKDGVWVQDRLWLVAGGELCSVVSRRE